MSAPHADRDHSEQPPNTATAGSDPTQGTSRSASARVVRASVAQVEAVMRALYWAPGSAPAFHEHARAVAEAVVAAGPDVATLHHGQPNESCLDADRRAEAAEAERDRLAEVVARVEALADEWEAEAPSDWARVHPDVEGAITAAQYVIVTEIRATLSGPTPAETPQNGPEPALSREQGTSGQSGEGEALRGAEKGSGCGAGCF